MPSCWWEGMWRLHTLTLTHASREGLLGQGPRQLWLLWVLGILGLWVVLLLLLVLLVVVYAGDRGSHGAPLLTCRHRWLWLLLLVMRMCRPCATSSTWHPRASEGRCQLLLPLRLSPCGPAGSHPLNPCLTCLHPHHAWRPQPPYLLLLLLL
jgi:hypothetical protein